MPFQRTAGDIHIADHDLYPCSIEEFVKILFYSILREAVADCEYPNNPVILLFGSSLSL